jgi:thymidylate synthase
LAKHWEIEYMDLIEHVMASGVEKTDRTGVGTKSIFGAQIRIDLSEGFPLLTARKMKLEVPLSELLWMLSGSTDERRLAEIRYGKPREELIGKRTIWTENGDNQGKALGHENTDLVKELGPIYGKQYRDFNGVDQISWVINEIKTNPSSRRLIVSAWNPADLPYASLPSCHCLFQFNVRGNKLDCQLYARSQDLFLGTPTNIPFYALLMHMVAQVCDLEVGEFIHTFGDAHVYLNHIDQITELLSRDGFAPPTLKMNPDIKNIFDFKMEDFELENYEHHPHISAPMAV